MSAMKALSPAQESASAVCARLHRAYRGFRLYPQDHPTARQTLDELVEALTSHLDSLGPLKLFVEESRLVYEDEGVYSHTISRDNLAFLMFRDGMRSITLNPGIEPREVEALVECLAHADQLLEVEHDLATVLWERELPHIDYEAVDPFLEGEGVQDEALADLRETVIRRLSELSSGSAPGPAGLDGGDGSGTGGRAGTGDGAARSSGLGLRGVGMGGGLGLGGAGGGDAAAGERAVEDWGLGELEAPDLSRLDVESIVLTQADIEQCERAVASTSAALEDFAVVLLEIIGDPLGSPGGDDAVERSLAMLIEQYFDGRDLDGLGRVVARLQSLEEQGRLPAGYGGELFDKAVKTERLTRLIAGISQGTPDDAARLGALLGQVRGWVFPSLLEILAESSDKGARRMVLALLNLEDGVPVEHLWPLMEDPRWYVVRNAVQLATGSGHPELARHLERLLRHPDERVRREVMRSLDALGGTRAVPLLLRALNDADSSVRILSVRALGRHGSRGHTAAVLAHVEPREFDALPAEEIEAFLLTLASLGGETVIDVLNKLWKRRVFGTRPLPVRLAAVQALGVIVSPAADKALAEASKSGEGQVQRTAVRARAEAQARSARPRA